MSSSWDGIWAALDARVRFGMLAGLERMEALLDAVGRPERSLECVQVAGTNGKGATACALWALLEASGEPAGLYVSPHLLHPGERIRLAGGPLPETRLAACWEELEPHVERLGASYFESLTALALLAFAREGVRRAVLECGLGGRLDATSVVRPRLSLLASVGADHLAVLGPTLADVARDKAHVAPPGGVLLSAVADPALAEVVEEVARRRGSCVDRVDPFVFPRVLEARVDRLSLESPGGLRLVLPADTRAWRCAGGLALAAAERLLPEGVPGAHVSVDDWPGRFQLRRTDPPVLLDVAHNPPALGWLVEEIQARWPGRSFQLVLAGMADKDLAANLRILAPVAATIHIWLPDAHRRAAGRDDWERAAALAGVTVDRWLDDPAMAELCRQVETGRAGGAWLVTGSFLPVAAWLGARNLPPGL